MYRVTLAEGGSVAERELDVNFRANAKTWANCFEARVIEPGIVSYSDVKQPMSYVSREAIAASMNSFVGRPLILHKKVKRNGEEVLAHKRVTPETMEDDAVGYISDWSWDDAGWAVVRGVVFDEEAKSAIRDVGLCSCGYTPTKVGPGGTYHAIPYEESILEFTGGHLAIVDKPRYEGATIRLNSKNQTTTTMIPQKFKFWQKKPAGARDNSTATTEATKTAAEQAAEEKRLKDEAAARDNAATEIDGATELEIPTADGKSTEKVTLATLIADRQNAKAAAGAEGELDGDAEIEIGDGKKAKVSDAVAALQRENARAATEAAEKLERENATKRTNAPAKPNHFRVILNARNRPGAAANANGLAAGGSPDSVEQRLERGKDYFGRKFKVAAPAGSKN